MAEERFDGVFMSVV
jgi:hypothetical protein